MLCGFFVKFFPHYLCVAFFMVFRRGKQKKVVPAVCFVCMIGLSVLHVKFGSAYSIRLHH